MDQLLQLDLIGLKWAGTLDCSDDFSPDAGR